MIVSMIDTPETVVRVRPCSEQGISEREIITLQQLADRWDCSEDFIKSRIGKGELTAFKLGRLWRVRMDSVHEFEKNATVQPSVRKSPTRVFERLRP